MIIPGLGQILNHNLKKGIILLTLVFLLFLGSAIKVALLVKKIINQPGIPSGGEEFFVERLRAETFSSLRYIIFAFLALWLYSVVDAFLTGKKMESQKRGDSP
ncbi:MAG: hypothetical protein JRJ66_03305 [Deltaproteobacteria bacterium]|nr:hypothetical protein [Deltaproteobacteria bacterium]